MDQMTLYQGDSCFRSWDNFKHCYPSASKWIGIHIHYGCKLWDFTNLAGPYVFAFNSYPSPRSFISTALYNLFERTLQNIVCHGTMPWSFSNIGQVLLQTAQTVSLIPHVAKRYLNQLKLLGSLVNIPTKELGFLKTFEQFSEDNLFKMAPIWFSYLQISQFEFSRFNQLDASSSESFVLHEAVESNNKEAIEYFLDQGFRMNQKDALGNTPLHRGAMRGALHSALCLLEKGADVWAKNDQGRNFLEAAIQNDQVYFIQQLLPLNFKMPWDEALAYAIGTNHVEIALLIARSEKVDLREKVPDETFTFEEFLHKMNRLPHLKRDDTSNETETYFSIKNEF